MSVYLQKATEYYHQSMEAADPRVSSWFLMATPWPMLSIVIMYMLAVKLGPRLMENRKAFDLKAVIILYNFGLVALSAYMTIEFILCVWAIPNFNYFCQGVEYIDDPKLIRHAKVHWLFFFSKIIEYLDTVFFILRKKQNQISFLHVYHHTSMCVLWWVTVKWNAGGTPYFGACFNSLVHVTMYTYYFISAFGPEYRKYLWWKKYITTFQIFQFVMIFCYVVNALSHDDCGFPAWLLWLYLVYDVTLIVLFGNFFVQAYGLKKAKEKAN